MSLTDKEFAFYKDCMTVYKNNMPYSQYLKLVQNPANPVMKGNHTITKEIYNSPLFRAVWDLGRRLAIRQGIITPDPNSNVEIEPVQ